MNRHGPCDPRDFKSLVSTHSTTPAIGWACWFTRRKLEFAGPESKRETRPKGEPPGSFLHRTGDPLNPPRYLLLGRIGEIQAPLVAAGTIGIETDTDHPGDQTVTISFPA